MVAEWNALIKSLGELVSLVDFQNLKETGLSVSSGVKSVDSPIVGHGRYRLGKPIGYGCFGEVFKGVLLDGSGAFAIKRANSSKGKKVLSWEAKNLRRLRGGPHIVALHDYLRDKDGTALLVTEYLDGGDLKRYVRARGRLDETEALMILAQIAQALAFAHGLTPPMVHRDLKPDNILAKYMVADRMSWFLADWGLAESWRTHRIERYSGTVCYMAPEIWRHERYLVSDVYSLGMTFYFMLFGQPAYNGESVQIASAQQAPEPVIIPAGCPDYLEKLLAGMLAKDPGKRWRLNQVIHYLGERQKRAVARLSLRVGGGAKRVWKACYQAFEMEFIWVPPGKFLMGMAEAEADESDRVLMEADQRATPRHLVNLTGFWMARYPVTRGQFRFFIEDSGYKTTAEEEGWANHYLQASDTFVKQEKSDWQNPGFEQTDDHPVVNVSYHDAEAFAQWLAWRVARLLHLPSEAQWEYACRANTRTSFAFGDTISTAQANFAGYYGGTTPVKQFPPNGFGLHDLHGNVYEWVKDWYDEAFYDQAPENNPICMTGECMERVLRSGSWHVPAGRIRSASRDRYAPNNRDADIGFRLAALSYPWES